MEIFSRVLDVLQEDKKVIAEREKREHELKIIQQENNRILEEKRLQCFEKQNEFIRELFQEYKSLKTRDRQDSEDSPPHKRFRSESHNNS